METTARWCPRRIDTGTALSNCSRASRQGQQLDTDVFTGIFEAIRTRTAARPYGADLKDPLDTAYRILPILALSVGGFCRWGTTWCDERNYVLRRILRRPSVTCHRPLGARALLVRNGAFRHPESGPNLP